MRTASPGQRRTVTLYDVLDSRLTSHKLLVAESGDTFPGPGPDFGRVGSMGSIDEQSRRGTLVGWDRALGVTLTCISSLIPDNHRPENIDISAFHLAGQCPLTFIVSP